MRNPLEGLSLALRRIRASRKGTHDSILRVAAIIGLGTISLVVGLVHRAFWDFLGSIPFVNTLLLILDVLIVVPLGILMLLLCVGATEDLSISSTRGGRICICLATSILVSLLFFLGGWIIYIYLKFGVWLSIGEALELFSGMFAIPAATSEPSFPFSLFTIHLDFAFYWIALQGLVPLLLLYLQYSTLGDSAREKAGARALTNLPSEQVYTSLDTRHIKWAFRTSKLLTRVVFWGSVGFAILAVPIGFVFSWSWELIGITAGLTIVLGIFPIGMSIMTAVGAILHSYARGKARRAIREFIIGEFVGSLEVPKGISDGRWFITNSSLIFEGEVKHCNSPDDVSFPLSRLENLEVRQGERQGHMATQIIATFKEDNDRQAIVIYVKHPRFYMQKFLFTIQEVCLRYGAHLPIKLPQ